MQHIRYAAALAAVAALVPIGGEQLLEPVHVPKDTPAAHQDQKAAMLLETWQQHMRSGHGTKVATQYHFAYARHLAPFNQGNITMLEVGANQGDSLFAWAAWFENAFSIFGLRYGVSDSRMTPCHHKYCAKVRIIDGDQSNSEDLKRLAAAAFGPHWTPPTALNAAAWADGGFDIIIDDGSHVPRHILFTFKHLFPHVRPGGVYIIEDNGFSYTDQPTKVYGYAVGDGGIGRPPPGNAIEKFKQLVDIVNREECMPTLDIVVFSEEIDRSVMEVSFVSGLVIVKKKTQTEFDGLRRLRPSSSVAMTSGGSLERYKARLAREQAV